MIAKRLYEAGVAKLSEGTFASHCHAVKLSLEGICDGGGFVIESL